MDIWGFSSLFHLHKNVKITFLEHTHKGMHLVDTFLEVECLGFYFHRDTKRKSLPRTAASELPLFCWGRGWGVAGEGPTWAPDFWRAVSPTLKPPGGHSAIPLLGQVEIRTPASPRSWPKGGAHLSEGLGQRAGKSGPLGAKRVDREPSQGARSLKLSPNHHLGQTSRLWGKWEILGWREAGRQEKKGFGLTGHSDNNYNKANWYVSTQCRVSCILHYLCPHSKT